MPEITFPLQDEDIFFNDLDDIIGCFSNGDDDREDYAELRGEVDWKPISLEGFTFEESTASFQRKSNFSLQDAFDMDSYLETDVSFEEVQEETPSDIQDAEEEVSGTPCKRNAKGMTLRPRSKRFRSMIDFIGSDEDLVEIRRKKKKGKKVGVSTNYDLYENQEEPGRLIGVRRSSSLSDFASKKVKTEANLSQIHQSWENKGEEFKIGVYTLEERKAILERHLRKRSERDWSKTVKYAVRKTFADSRLRVKGRFISKADEGCLREQLMLMM